MFFEKAFALRIMKIVFLRKNFVFFSSFQEKIKQCRETKQTQTALSCFMLSIFNLFFVLWERFIRPSSFRVLSEKFQAIIKMN